jgi:hypothetical protein
VQFYLYEGWSKISGTEFIVGKRKHIQVTRSYLLQSTTLQIVRSDSSDPSTFQCVIGRLVWEWPATAVSYLVVSPRRLEIVSPSGCYSAWGRGRSRRWPNLVRRVGNHGDAVLCQEFPDTQGRVAWRIVVVQKPGTGRPFVKPFPTNCISSEFISNLSDRQMPVPADYCIDTVNSLVGSRRWWPACVWIIVDGRVAIFKLGIPLKCLGSTQRSPNACCSISHVSVAVLPIFWENLIQTRCCFNTSISQYGGGTSTIAL